MKATPVVLKRKEEASAGGGLSFSEAMRSPCTTCDTAPCCSHLPLPGFPVENLMQVDHARWLLGFEGIELGISHTGEWSVFYTASCRHLDRSDNSCTLHGTDLQPEICVNYNPYTCWYRRTLTGDLSPEFVRLDAHRLELLLPHLCFDQDRNLVGVPTWDALQELFATVPMTETEPQAPPPDAVTELWQEIAVGRRAEPEVEPRTAADLLAADPCSGCAAHCCENLQFPIEAPTAASSVDYYRFALGFPGVSLGVGDDGWSFLVRTRCRHLESGRCSLYGSPQRPLRCRYFDAYQCPYPTLLGSPRPAGFVRVDLDALPALEGCLEFNSEGGLLRVPAADAVREAVEGMWRDRATAAPLA